MMNPSTESADTDLVIDTIARATAEGIASQDFLPRSNRSEPADPNNWTLLRNHEPTMTGVGFLLRCCANDH